MKKLTYFTSILVSLSLFSTPLHAQEEIVPAYEDSTTATYMSAVLPISALAIAAIIIATTDRKHHFSSGSGSSSSHAHSAPSSGSSSN